jgi:kynureninase
VTVKNTPAFQPSAAFAGSLDQADPLRRFRNQFAMPVPRLAGRMTYLDGDSLGLQPKAAREMVLAELDKWAYDGARAHFETDRPWIPYHTYVAEPMARLTGSLASEVIAMNGLTVNLHLLMVSFYRPTAQRHKIIIEDRAFPSDHFAVDSQIRAHGLDPDRSLVVVSPRAGEETLRTEDLLGAIEEQGPELALVLLPGIQYYTGQVLPMAELARAAHAVGARIGLDLAHAVGNIELSLHDWDVDFAVWCTYKYLNSGPGSTGVGFVHQRHHGDSALPRYHGWWGHDPGTRFAMDTAFQPIPTAEAWLVSNSPILAMAPVLGSLAVFEEAGGMGPLRAKAELMIRYMDYLVDTKLAGKVEAITPRDLSRRGCQHSLRILDAVMDGETVYQQLMANDVQCGWRYPDAIRVAPVPLYNSFADIHRFVSILHDILDRGEQ